MSWTIGRDLGLIAATLPWMLNWVTRLAQVPSSSLRGKAMRLPLRLIPSDLEIPILLGPMRGYRWIVGSGNHSCWLGVYERTKQVTFAATIPPGAIVFDVGAHVGFYTLLFARLVGSTGRVIAFEPSTRNLQFLRRHVKLNHIGNVEIIEAAVSDSDGTGAFAEHSSSYNGALDASGTTRVRQVKVDNLCASGRIPFPNVIKIDVEGAEDLVLAGARSTIAGASPTIFIATHGREVDARCVQLLGSMGYTIVPMAGDPLEWRELLARPGASGVPEII
jgi:FkbM family methyltransferase